MSITEARLIYKNLYLYNWIPKADCLGGHQANWIHAALGVFNITWKIFAVQCILLG